MTPRSRNPKVSRAIRFVAFQLCALVLLLVVFEGIVRLTMKDISELGTSKSLISDSTFGISPGLRPGASGTSNGVRFDVQSFNGHGFWSYANPPEKSNPSWLFLGDSVTMGIGVDPDSTFTGRISMMAPGVNVLNPSVVGYSLLDYQRVLESLTATDSEPGPQIDRILIFWCLNDLYFGEQVQGDGRSPLVEQVLAFLRRNARSYQFLKTLFFDRPESYFRHDTALYTPAALDASRTHFERIRELADRVGAPITIVLLPYEVQLRSARSAPPSGIETSLSPQVKMARLLDTLGIDHVDVSEAMIDSGLSSSGLYLYGDGIHFSATGHRVVAEALGRHLSSDVSLEPSIPE